MSVDHDHTVDVDAVVDVDVKLMEKLNMLVTGAITSTEVPAFDMQVLASDCLRELERLSSLATAASTSPSTSQPSTSRSASFIPIEALEVIGYATKLTEYMVPTVVTPVFRLKAYPHRVVFPPFRLYQGGVHEATVCDQSEFDELTRRDEVVPLESPIAAQACFELWVDDTMVPHYEDQEEVDDKLSRIAQQAVLDAREALRSGDLNKAERLAALALSADDRHIEPLVIMATIRCLQEKESGVKVMTQLAEGLCSVKIFKMRVDRLLKDITTNEKKGKDV